MTRHDQGRFTLGDFFTIKRGVETGDNSFFILNGLQTLQLGIPQRFLRPILPGPHLFSDNEIVSDPEGYPIVDHKLFLLDAPLPEEEIRELYPALYTYLQQGIADGVHLRYSCRHRSPWYAQEQRPPAPYLCAYMGRSSGDETPFRFILNHSRAIAPNIFLMMYPRPALARRLADNYPMRVTLWGELNNIGALELARRDKIYGDGDGRLEPNELASVSADRIVRLFPDLVPDPAAQMMLFGGGEVEPADE